MSSEFFDKDKYLAQHKTNKENSNFLDYEDGFYILELKDASLNKAQTSGRKQCSFIWEFTDENDKYSGKIFGVHKALESAEDYGFLDWELNALKVNPEAFAADPENMLEKMIGMKVRMQLFHKETDKGVFLNHRIKKILHSPLTQQEVNSAVKSAELQVSSNTVAPKTEEIALSIGMEVMVKRDNGEFKAKIQGADESTQKAMVKYADSNIAPELVGLDQLRPIPSNDEIVGALERADTKAPSNPVANPSNATPEELVEELVEDAPFEEVKLEVGMNVTGIYNGATVKGEVYKLDNGVVKVKVGNKAFPCKKETIKVL